MRHRYSQPSWEGSSRARRRGLAIGITTSLCLAYLAWMGLGLMLALDAPIAWPDL